MQEIRPGLIKAFNQVKRKQLIVLKKFLEYLELYKLFITENYSDLKAA